jgi:hypothetical protein
MSQSQPPSIFADHSAQALSASASSRPQSSRRGTLSAPCTPPEKQPSRPIQTRQSTWTPTPRLDLGDSISRPLVTPPHRVEERGRRGSGRGGLGTSTPWTLPAIAGKKRPPPPDDSALVPASPQEPASEPLHKRRRVQPWSRYSLDRFSVPTSAQFQLNRQPPSPLFFSQHPRPRLPPRFSSSEAAARMLSKTRGEEGGIKTVTLARGSFNGLSPQGAASGSSARSSERSSLPRTASPDARDRTDPLRLLGSVGIVELLEQDTRPTFIVDMGDLANYSPESSRLQILFANAALRSTDATWALVAGKAPQDQPDEATALASNHFRNWLLSTSLQGDSPESNPSPIEHGGVIWSCYTLRKRLRVVSGAVPTHATASITPATDPNEFPIPSTSSMGGISGNSVFTTSSIQQQNEPQDYFGTTGSTIVERRPTPPLSEALQDRTNTTKAVSRDVAGIFQKPTEITLPSIEDASSFNNECVLRAHCAGDVDSFHREQNSHQEHDMGFFDWTRLPLTASLPRHIQFARSIDWASTHLGPIEYWSNDLRAMCNLIM